MHLLGIDKDEDDTICLVRQAAEGNGLLGLE